MPPSRPARPGRKVLARVLGLLLAAGGTGTAGGVEPAGILADFPRGRLTIIQAPDRGPGRCLFLEVYLATADDLRARGLMYVTRLEEFEGMYFPYPVPALISMWMKNTYIPLDMAFVEPGGRIGGIAADTQPLSLERIRSPGPVTGVLEVNGGFAARWDVRAGDRVTLEP